MIVVPAKVLGEAVAIDQADINFSPELSRAFDLAADYKADVRLTDA